MPGPRDNEIVTDLNKLAYWLALRYHKHWLLTMNSRHIFDTPPEGMTAPRFDDDLKQAVELAVLETTQEFGTQIRMADAIKSIRASLRQQEDAYGRYQTSEGNRTRNEGRAPLHFSALVYEDSQKLRPELETAKGTSVVGEFSRRMARDLHRTYHESAEDYRPVERHRLKYDILQLFLERDPQIKLLKEHLHGVEDRRVIPECESEGITEKFINTAILRTRRRVEKLEQIIDERGLEEAARWLDDILTTPRRGNLRQLAR